MNSSFSDNYIVIKQRVTSSTLMEDAFLCGLWPVKYDHEGLHPLLPQQRKAF